MILATWYHVILATLFGLLAIILMGVILLQRGKGVGLAGAFGGAGGHTAFGAKTGDVLTWATIVIAVLLLTFAVILNYVFVPLTPFATPTVPPPIPAVVPAATGTETPGETTAPTEGAVPVEPAPSTEADAPAESRPPQQEEAPLEPRETPEGAWNPGDRATWPQYARRDIFGADLG
ncbi:MAG: preprotein translocase subunit SecG [Phycisphaerae bacterium]